MPSSSSAPPATGLPATRLLGVESITTAEGAGLRILGDGEFNYSTFELENPPRFVIDLKGVVNTSPRSSLAIEGSAVSQVRMAQFEPYPNPVTRVVLDLAEDSVPTIGRGPDGLVLSFSGAPSAGSSDALVAELDDSASAVEPEPEPADVVAESEPTQEAETGLSEQDETFGEAADATEMEVAQAIEATGLETQSPETAAVDSQEAEASEAAAPRVLVALSDEPSEADTGSSVAAAEEFEVEEPFTTETSPSEGTLELAEAAPLEEELSAPIEIVLSPEDEQESLGVQEPFDVAADSQEPPEALQEPLFIEDTSRRERPTLIEGGRDVTLYEGQEPTPLQAQAEQRSGSAAPSFGVQTVDNTRRWVGEPVTMSLKDASITEVLRTIARVSNLNLVIQPGVEGTVTVELVAVPWDQALDQILKVNGLGMQLDGNILRVAQTQVLQAEAVAEQTLKQARALSVPLTTVLKRLSYAKASDVSRILTQAQRSGGRGGSLGRLGLVAPAGILSQRGTVAIDNRTNTLIIQELPDYLDTVIQVIENLDTPERQVMIEARIVEATRNFSRTLGVQWGLLGEASAQLGNSTGLQFPNRIQADGGVQLLRGGNNGSLNLNLGNILNSFQLDVALQAAESEGLINIISAPKVATLNNERASVQSGLQIPIQTVANNTVSVQFINATLRLSVQPQVTAEGTIIMDIDIQKREPLLAFAVVGATNAPISTRDAQTRVIVRDGGTAVIGGIYSISSNEGTDRVPGLANIPILGHLFKNRAKDTSNEELLIFITPRVIQL
jgi:type IV pilus assembly protein PilQ